MMNSGKFLMEKFPQWIDTLRKYPEPNQAPARHELRQRIHRPFGITKEQWFGLDSIKGAAYDYQAKCELGYFDYHFDMILDDAASAKAYNDYWIQHAGCRRDLGTPYYRTLTFNPTLYTETMAATQNTTKPIVLIYGLDDTWTGAAVKDEFINGTNVRKFILPAQNHLVTFSSNTDKTQCDAIRAILDGVLNSPTGLEDVAGNGVRVTGRKVLRDGQPRRRALRYHRSEDKRREMNIINE